MASAKFQIERKCEICGKSFIAKTLTSRYCSKNCSQAAYKQRKKEELLDALKREKAARVPKNQPYLSIADATALFDIGRDSLYRLIRNKQVRYYNLGRRMIRICKADLQERFNLRPYDERRKENEISDGNRKCLFPSGAYRVYPIPFDILLVPHGEGSGDVRKRNGSADCGRNNRLCGEYSHGIL